MEVLVTIMLLSIALIGTAGEIAIYVKQQKIENSQTVATHLADSWFEYAESLHRAAGDPADNTVGVSRIAANLPASVTSTTPTVITPSPVVNGVTYTETVQARICTPAQLALPNFTITNCTATAISPVNTIYSTIRITWRVGGQGHTLTMTRNLADDSTYKPANTTDPGGNALSNCSRALVKNENGTVSNIASATLEITPATQSTFSGALGRVTVDGTFGHPKFGPSGSELTSPVTVTLKETGLANSEKATDELGFGAPSCVPLYWTDSTGTHQISLHTASSGTGACNDSTGADLVTKNNYTSKSCWYTGTIPLSSITQFPSSLNANNNFDATIPFCAMLLGSQTTCPATNTTTDHGAKTNLYVNLAPSITCTVNNGFAITRLLGNIGAVPVKCTVANATRFDTLTVSPPVRSVTMTSTDGVTWSGSLSAGSYPSGSQIWTFKIQRTAAGEDQNSATISMTVATLL